jgi:hypothetical protein
MIAPMIVVIDEPTNAGLKVTWQALTPMSVDVRGCLERIPMRVKLKAKGMLDL